MLWEPTEGVAQNGQALPYSYRIEPHCEQLFITCPFCAADVPFESSKGRENITTVLRFVCGVRNARVSRIRHVPPAAAPRLAGDSLSLFSLAC